VQQCIIVGPSEGGVGKEVYKSSYAAIAVIYSPSSFSIRRFKDPANLGRGKDVTLSDCDVDGG
jgi:hypothetical protein